VHKNAVVILLLDLQSHSHSLLGNGMSPLTFSRILLII